jgi:2-hydroxy-6-oxonona-2,4-dienedioate hydrolase
MDEKRYRATERRMWESVRVTPTERRLHLARNDVNVRIQEVGEGPSILFVHGACNSGTSWAELVAHLDGFHCILLDRPGCGLSDALPGGLSRDGMPGFADTLVVDVLDAMGMDTTLLAATSWGGYVGLRTAAAHPERVERLMLYGWSLGVPSAPIPVFMRLSAVPGVSRLTGMLPLNDKAVRAMFRRIGLRQALEAGLISDELVECYLALLRDTDTMLHEIIAGPRMISPFHGLDDRLVLSDELLAGISTPTYLLWGEHDPFGDADTARRLASALPDAALQMVPGAGHAVWLDDVKLVARTTADFMGAAA